MQLADLIPKYSKQNKGKYVYTFTVFTPVYNRANTLHRVFKSLNEQTFKDFELVIINDGSSDASHKVAEKLIAKANFPVNYVNNKSNQHKMACFIQAITLAKGKFLLPFDSDDECAPNALEVFFNEYESIPEEKKKNISGVTSLCKDQNGNLIGSPFLKSPLYSNTFKQQLKSSKSLEKWGFTKTDILKGITVNPNIFSRGYIPEGILWELLAKEGFETKYINQALRTYYLDTENAISIQNHEKDAFGMAIYSLSILNWYYKDYLLKSPKIFLKRIYTLLRASRYLEFNLSDYRTSIKSKCLGLLFVLGWPFKEIL
ncbi:glycosyltransferase family 2 protein [Mangrovimonas cancribranchiae]|uniref:Glycosyltransferase family 2 protein n=1 Tax=Mangrovimonas cancribranchiae TaxID=3080055 RepID=A0AAU6PBL4_9FLAO